MQASKHAHPASPNAHHRSHAGSDVRRHPHDTIPRPGQGSPRASVSPNPLHLAPTCATATVVWNRLAHACHRRRRPFAIEPFRDAQPTTRYNRRRVDRRTMRCMLCSICTCAGLRSSSVSPRSQAASSLLTSSTSTMLRCVIGPGAWRARCPLRARPTTLVPVHCHPGTWQLLTHTAADAHPHVPQHCSGLLQRRRYARLRQMGADPPLPHAVEAWRQAAKGKPTFATTS